MIVFGDQKKKITECGKEIDRFYALVSVLLTISCREKRAEMIDMKKVIENTR